MRPVYELTVVIVLMAAACIGIGWNAYELRHLQMDWDEAVHANRGLDFAVAVATGSWEKWAHQVTKLDWYPPGHGMTLSAWILLVEPSLLSVRLYSTLWFFLLGILLWLAVRQIAPRAGPWVHWLPPVFLAADSLHLIHGAMSMLELPAIVLGLASLYFFNRSWKSDRNIDHLLSGLLALFCFLTKYNYGLVVFATLGICYGFLGLRALRRQAFWSDTKGAWMAWLPVVGILALWLFALDGWEALARYSRAQPQDASLWSARNLFFYPRLLLAHSLGWLALGLSALGLVILAKRRCLPPGLVPYLVFMVIASGVLFLTLRQQDRFGMILYPPLWVTGAVGLGAVEQTRATRSRIRAFTAIVYLLLIGGMVNSQTHLHSRLRLAYENTNSGVDDAYYFIRETMAQQEGSKAHVVVLGRRDRWNSDALQFYLQVREFGTREMRIWQVVDDRILSHGWPHRQIPEPEQEMRYEQALEQADYLVLFSRPWPGLEGWRNIASRVFAFGGRQAEVDDLIEVAIYTPD